jgi:hypothetical protein
MKTYPGAREPELVLFSAPCQDAAGSVSAGEALLMPKNKGALAHAPHAVQGRRGVHQSSAHSTLLVPKTPLSLNRRRQGR